MYSRCRVGANLASQEDFEQTKGLNGFSLSDDISATSTAHPNLVKSVRINIDPCAPSERLLCRLLVFGICNGELAVEDQMRSQATMAVWRVMGVSVSLAR